MGKSKIMIWVIGLIALVIISIGVFAFMNTNSVSFKARQCMGNLDFCQREVCGVSPGDIPIFADPTLEVIDCWEKVAKQVDLQPSKIECESQGGIYGQVGLSQEIVCNLPTSDGGKTCTDSSQCESGCIGEAESSTSGQCGDFTLIVGCDFHLLNGQAIILCID